MLFQIKVQVVYVKHLKFLKSSSHFYSKPIYSYPNVLGYLCYWLVSGEKV